jgi:hypothetical protein
MRSLDTLDLKPDSDMPHWKARLGSGVRGPKGGCRGVMVGIEIGIVISIAVEGDVRIEIDIRIAFEIAPEFGVAGFESCEVRSVEE